MELAQMFDYIIGNIAMAACDVRRDARIKIFSLLLPLS